MNQKQHQGWISAQSLFLLLLTFFFYSRPIIAQVTVAVAPNKMNVLYIGVDNPVSIAASNSADEQTTAMIEGGGGTIEKSGSGIYIVRVKEVSDKCLIKVYVNGKLAGTSSFRVRSLPIPLPTIGGYPSGETISFAALQSQAGVGAYIRDFPFDVRYKIIGFTLSVKDKEGNVKSIDCQSALFSPEAKQYISQYAKPGTSITIEKIRATDPGERELNLPALVYHIQ